MRRGDPLRTVITRATELKPQFILVYWVFTVSSVSMEVLVAFTKAYLCNAFTELQVFSQIYGFCKMFKDDCVLCQRTSGINVEIHAKLFMFAVYLRSHLHYIWS